MTEVSSECTPGLDRPLCNYHLYLTAYRYNTVCRSIRYIYRRVYIHVFSLGESLGQSSTSRQHGFFSRRFFWTSLMKQCRVKLCKRFPWIRSNVSDFSLLFNCIFASFRRRSVFLKSFLYHCAKSTKATPFLLFCTCLPVNLKLTVGFHYWYVSNFCY